MTDIDERRRRALAAQTAMEIAGPVFDSQRAEYLAALTRIAVSEPWEAGKMTKLAIAQNVISAVEAHFKALILDGEMAGREKDRVDEIMKLPEAKRRWI